MQIRQLLELQLEELRRIRKFRILNILEYDQMRHRRNQVQKQLASIQQELTPYGGVFPWAFGVDKDEVGDEDQTWKYRVRDDFADWLALEGGTFQVRGKPGSGKSIFMEHLFSHPVTKKELEIRSSKFSELLKLYKGPDANT